MTRPLLRLPVVLALSAALIGTSGFASAERYSGYLRDGASTSSEWIYLNRGDMITATGSCDIDCDDLDLYLVNGAGNVVDRDTDDDDVPVVVYTIRSNDWYRVQTYMADCSGVCGYTTNIVHF